MKKRIIAAILSFILLANSSMSVFATQAGSFSVSDFTENAAASENEIPEESEESGEDVMEESESGENTDLEEGTTSEAGSSVGSSETDESSVEDTEAENESVFEEETTAEMETTIESETMEETTTVLEPELMTDSLTALANGIPLELDAIVQEAKEELQELAEAKEIYALVYLTDSYKVKKEPYTEADTVTTVSSAKTVQILDVEVEWNYNADWEEYLPTVWYYVQFYVGETLKKGYIEDVFLAYSDELLIEWKDKYPELFPPSISVFGANTAYASSTSYADVEQFPSDYQIYLRELKDKYPNWTFVPMNVGRDWDDCVDEQMGNYSWIYYNQPEEFRGSKINSTWYYASRAGIEYYMDPRNFLTDSYIFQFEQNTYNSSYHSQSALQTFLNNTFMKGKVPDDSQGRTYAKVIYDSGKSRGLSPFNLAARVIQEQGINGTSAMISGTYSGYEGYYNHYNISASGTTDAEVIRNGLAYAKTKGWNTRVKSLEGGAAFIGNGYILQGQDTLYLQKFDIMHGSDSLHQYMQNIMAPYTEGQSMRKMYNNAGSLSSSFVFKIPVFDDMPTLGYTMTSKSSVKLEKGKTLQIAMKYNGTKISDLSIFTFESEDTDIATVSSTGLITAVGSGKDYSGKTTVTATLRADKEISFDVKVIVTCPLTDISLDIEDAELFFHTDGLPDKIPYIENGVTKYYTKSECPTETTVTVLYHPTDTTDDRSVIWTIEDESIVTYEALDDNAASVKLTAKAGGSTTITAQVGKYKAVAEVSVRVPITDAWLSENELTLYKGQTAQITADYFPYDTTDTVDLEWESDNDAVAKVVNDKIVAVGKGRTTLRAAIGPFAFEGVDEATAEKLTVSVIVEEYTVTFTNEDGSILLETPGTYGETLANLGKNTEVAESIEIPWELKKEGYIFAGWYTAENGEGDPVTQDTVLYKNMVLYPYFMSTETQFYVKPIGSVIYTGGYLKPTVTVYAGDKQLTKGVDYTVTYVNNKDVWDPETDAESLKPKAVIKGRGQYAGNEAIAQFIIVPKNITDIDVTAPNVMAAFDGKLHKIQPFVADAGRILQKDIDYTVSYPSEMSSNGDINDNAYRQPGTWPIQITGKGNYIGTRNVYLTITKRTAITEASVSAIKDVTYNDGAPFESEQEVKAWEPKPVITYQKKTLTEGVDYELTYANNKDIGTATVTITGIGAFIGTRTESFRITGTDISTVQITGIQNMEYTSERIILDSIVVKNKKKQILTEGTDYELLFENNKEVGKAYVILIGKNGYTGTLKTPFYIEPYNLTTNSQTYEPEAGVTKQAFEVISDETIEYERSGAEPAVTAYFRGTELTEGVDYKVTYKNNHQTLEAEDGSKPTIVITGKGSFTGTYEKTFTITQKDIAGVTMSAKDVAFRNRKGFCFVEPVLKDTGGRRLAAGTDYSGELVYTYATDVVLYDGTIRLAGEAVEVNDIPTPGELNDAAITVTAKGIGNYTGEISVTYRILENTSWFEDWFGNEEPKLNMNRTVMYLNRLYPEYTDTIKIGVDDGGLLTGKTKVTCDTAAAADWFTVTLSEDRLSIQLNGSREELTEAAGNYTFTISATAEINGEEAALPERTLTVKVSAEEPTVNVETSGNIDLLYRDTTAARVTLSMTSQKDGLLIPANESEMNSAYKLSGDDAGCYEIVYESSSFTSEKNVQLCIRAVESNAGEEQLTPGKVSNLTLQYQTKKGIVLTADIVITPQQTEYQITPKTTNCYIKMEEGSGQIIFTSSPADIVYQSVTCSDDRVEVSVFDRTILINVLDISEFVIGEQLNLTISAYAKNAGKDTKPATAAITLVFCDTTELEKLLASKDNAELSLAERQTLMTSYAETVAVNALDKKIIAANTIDFSNVKIAFLGDSITEGAGLEKTGVEANVYCSVVKRVLNVKEVYRLGIGGAGIGRNGDCYSLYDYYQNIPKDTDIIFVQAGINDVYAGSEQELGSLFNLSQTGTFCADTYELMSTLQTEYPTAQIIFLTPLSTITSTWYKDMLPQMLSVSRYVAVMKVLAQREELYNVEVWDLYNSNILDSYDKDIRSKYMYDGVHPGVAGHRVLGEYIASNLIQQRSGYNIIDAEQLPETEYVTPQMYRESADEDDTDSINRAIKDAQGKAVYIPAGTYRINTNTGIKIRDNTNLIMSPNAKIKAIVSAENHYKIFRLTEVNNVTIFGGQIIGDRYSHSGTEGEWGMGIRIYDSTNVRISDVTISDCWGDGIYIGSEDDDEEGAGCDNVIIENCHFTNNRRNNLSIVCGKNITVNNCTFEKANGTAPEFGIDIEPNYPDINQCEKIVISNSIFVGNNGGSIGIMTASNDITVSDCVMDGMFLNYAGTNVTILNSTINGEMDARIGVILDDKTIINDGTSTEDVLIATLNVDKESYDFIDYQINADNLMSASVIEDSDSPSGKALSLRRLSQGTQESGYYLKLSEFELEDGVSEALESGVTYRFEYVVKGNGFWGIKTNQTGWYPCIPIEDEYRTCFTTYKAKAADSCQLLLYAVDMTKDMHIEVSSVKIYKVR